VLQVCSEFDKPDPPGPAARKAFGRLIVGLSDADRSAFKANLLKTTRAQVLSAAETYFAPGKSPIGIAVIAGQEHLTTANAQLGDNPLTLKTI
jgi:presequence protease